MTAELLYAKVVYKKSIAGVCQRFVCYNLTEFAYRQLGLCDDHNTATFIFFKRKKKQQNPDKLKININMMLLTR